MKKNLLHQSGITLLELIIATAIVSIISTISVSSYRGYIETTKVSQAVAQIRGLTLLIEDYALDYGEYPENLRDIGNEDFIDPWGNPYTFLNLKINKREDDDRGRDDDDHDHDDRINIGSARKDGSLVLINTNYDLCSSGKDGKSKPPLRAKDSQDDIIYANDGDYIGLTSEF